MHRTDYEDNKSDSHVSCVHKTIHSHILSYKTRFSSSPVAFHHLHSKMDADSYNTFSPERNHNSHRFHNPQTLKNGHFIFFSPFFVQIFPYNICNGGMCIGYTGFHTADNGWNIMYVHIRDMIFLFYNADLLFFSFPFSTILV